MTMEAANGRAGALRKQRRGSPVSEDLRGRAVAAVLKDGMSAAAASRRFGLSESAVRNWVRRFRGRGHLRPDPMGGGVSRIEPERERIFCILEARPGLTIRGLCAELAAKGLFFGSSTVHCFLKRDRHLARNRRKRRWTGR